jgi:O-antigen/teichoic acid export membrane protein
MSFLTRTLGTLGSQGLLILLGFLNSAIVANLLGAEGQGTFAFLLLVPTLLVMVSNFGIGIADVYFTGSRRYPVSVLAVQSIIFAGVIGSAVIVGFFAVTQFFPIRDSQLLKMVIWVIPFSLSTLFLGNLFQGLNQIRDYNLTTLIPKLTLFLLIVVALVLLKTQIKGVAVAYLAAEIFAAILLLILFYRKVLAGNSELRLNLTALKDMLHFGVQGFVGNIFNFLNYRLDMFIILFFLDQKALGFYSISVLFSEKIWLVPNSISIVLFPHVAANSQKQEITPFICRTSVWLTFILALALFFVADSIIRMLFIEEFVASVLPLKILLPGIISLGIMKILSADLAGRGKPILLTITSVATVITNFGANWLLIPRFGIAGAALASTLSYTISAGMSIIFYQRVSGNKISELFLPTSADFHFYTNFLKKLF